MTAIQAAFVKLIQVPTRSAYQLVMEVPEEAIDHVLAVLGGAPKTGTHQWVGIAPLKEEENGQAVGCLRSGGSAGGSLHGGNGNGATDNRPSPSESGRPSRRELTEGERLRTRAVLLCRDRRFQEWLCGADPEENMEAETAEALRRELELDSRSELATNTAAQAKFLALEAQYRAETGQAAERRDGQ
jgi:hypothetical protein